MIRDLVACRAKLFFHLALTLCKLLLPTLDLFRCLIKLFLCIDKLCVDLFLDSVI